jgi:hypothetical protein
MYYFIYLLQLDLLTSTDAVADAELGMSLKYCLMHSYRTLFVSIMSTRFIWYCGKYFYL